MMDKCDLSTEFLTMSNVMSWKLTNILLISYALDSDDSPMVGNRLNNSDAGIEIKIICTNYILLAKY
jgi:hypothetical protein